MNCLWICLSVGFIGFIIGFFTAALLSASSRADDMMYAELEERHSIVDDGSPCFCEDDFRLKLHPGPTNVLYSFEPNNAKDTITVNKKAIAIQEIEKYVGGEVSQSHKLVCELYDHLLEEQG